MSLELEVLSVFFFGRLRVTDDPSIVVRRTGFYWRVNDWFVYETATVTNRDGIVVK